MMYFLLIFLLFIGFLMLLLYYVNIKTNFTFNTDDEEFFLIFDWLAPFLKADIKAENYSFVLSIFLFDKKIYVKQLKKRDKKRRTSLIKLDCIVFNNSYAAIYYGFNSPFSTGITNGLFQAILPFVNNMDIDCFPDFLPEREYIIIKARTQINAGKSIINAIQNSMTNQRNKRSKRYGTV